MNIFYYDDENFKYDIYNMVGDFLGDIVVFSCDIIEKMAERNPINNAEEKSITIALITDYLKNKEPFGLKEWGLTFYKENEMIKIVMSTLFNRKSVDINVIKMKVEIK